RLNDPGEGPLYLDRGKGIKRFFAAGGKKIHLREITRHLARPRIARNGLAPATRSETRRRTVKRVPNREGATRAADALHTLRVGATRARGVGAASRSFRHVGRESAMEAGLLVG
ncbi:MAG TPA: hypothetical protein VG389_19335, partial [Myxococcota bacterium]|nr:hypothetical protein [Myxococcota bacterium]